MPQGINTYGGGGAPTTTQTEINTGPAGPSGFYDAGFMNFLRRPRRSPQEHMPPEVRLPTANERALDDAKTQALLAQYKAESEPAPLMWTPGGMNNPSHLEMDIHHMTGAQRERFLPQNSGMVPFENKEPSSLEEDVRSGGLMASNQDVAAQKGELLSSRGANEGAVRRQQFIKDQQLQNYYGIKPQEDNQQRSLPGQYGSGRG